MIQEGSKVKLNMESYKQRKDKEKLAPNYAKFVEENENTIFTAARPFNRKKYLSIIDGFTFLEDDTWDFLSDDLIEVNNE
jgi:hypothetical protein